ncbi:TetR/AcrR family transcriptional regulator [Xanthobacter sp. AM11]|uniref:TetR/AcrR family transcriptional regulator n=1 Tax=Xanthobacter sp. AM11 TaxID=3380643 RepID=UPI0039BF8758
MAEQVQRRGSDTRERILVLAEEAVLAKGFAATSIEELICAVGITKSGFFYHFRDKTELAKAMMLRYLERDRALLDDLFRRADELDEDPLHGLLIALKFFAEMMAQLPEAHPGCLAASFCYQDQLFNREIRDMNARSMLDWRDRCRARFELIARAYPPREEVDLEALSDMLATMVEGALILGRALRDPTILPRQVLQFRAYVRLLFAPCHPAG